MKNVILLIKQFLPVTAFAGLLVVCVLFSSSSNKIVGAAGGDNQGLECSGSDVATFYADGGVTCKQRILNMQTQAPEIIGLGDPRYENEGGE